jgi:formate dehydrogenase maturation protein FdhE
MTLTKETKRLYLKSGGSECPYCHSDKIEAMEQVQIDGSSGYQAVHCYTCNKDWNDIYTLTDIEAVE